MIDAYFASLMQTVAASPAVTSSSITLDQRSSYIGLVRGDVYFLDGSVLHVREFVNTPASHHIPNGALPGSRKVTGTHQIRPS